MFLTAPRYRRYKIRKKGDTQCVLVHGYGRLLIQNDTEVYEILIPDYDIEELQQFSIPIINPLP